jgi:hypothetical protein
MHNWWEMQADALLFAVAGLLGVVDVIVSGLSLVGGTWTGTRQSSCLAARLEGKSLRSWPCSAADPPQVQVGAEGEEVRW